MTFRIIFQIFYIFFNHNCNPIIILTFCRILEWFHELKKKFSVGQKSVGYLAAEIFFIQKANMNQWFGMLGNGFKIGIKLFRDAINRNLFIVMHDW